jgi:hypothetical protein
MLSTEQTYGAIALAVIAIIIVIIAVYRSRAHSHMKNKNVHSYESDKATKRGVEHMIERSARQYPPHNTGLHPIRSHFEVDVASASFLKNADGSPATQ